MALALACAHDTSAQSNAIGDYTDLINALNGGITNLTNFAFPLTINLLSNQPTIQITGNVTIDAGTSNLSFNGHGIERIFYVAPTASLTLNGVELSNGFSTNGGAIYNAGTLVISNCTFISNNVVNSNGTAGAEGLVGEVSNGGNGGNGLPAAGGAIYSTGPLFVYSSLFTNNYAQAGNGGAGGNANGVEGNGGNAGNGANASGGAIYSTGSNNVFYMTEFMLNGCFAGSGGNGGVYATNGLTGPLGNGGQAGLGGIGTGGAVFLTGALQMTDCLFSGNFAEGGSTGAAQTNYNGSGQEGSPGGAAFGGAIYFTNSRAVSSIVNTIFYTNYCFGGTGGSTTLNAAVGGTGGTAEGAGIWSAAANVLASFCTFADSYAYGGNGGSNYDAGINGSQGTGTGNLIFRSAGTVDLYGSVLTTGSGFPTVAGATDLGYNVCSDGNLTRGAGITSTLLNSNPNVAQSFTQFGSIVGGASFGSQILTLELASTNSPAAGFVPGVPGVSFPATDQVLQNRPTPATAGAFEMFPVTTLTNTVPTNFIVSTLPAITLTGNGRTVKITNEVNLNIYSNSLALGYQWQFNGTNIYDNGHYSGTTSTLLTIKNTTVGDQGLYTVIVSPTLLEGAASNTVEVLLTNAPAITQQPPSSLTRPYGSIVTITVGAGEFPSGYYYQWLFSANSSTPPQTLTNLEDGNIFITNNILTINPATDADEGSYSVIVSNGFGTNNFGSKTSIVTHLTITADKTKPTLTIVSPSPRHYSSRTNTLEVEGITSDNAQVAYVQYWFTNINAGLSPANNVVTGYALLLTNGSTNINVGVTNYWYVTNPPPPGTNIFAVRSVDYSSNASAIQTLKIFYESTNTLVLTTNTSGGLGKLAGHAFFKGDNAPSNNASLNVGEGYTIVATPNANSLLGEWIVTNITGSNILVTITNGNTLHFIMESNLSIQALFVTNPFVATGVHGTFNGLFYILPDYVTNDLSTNDVVGTNGMTNLVVTTNAIYTNELAFDSAGMLSGFSVNKEGAFSGRLLLAGYAYGLSGNFDGSGVLTNFLVNRPANRGGPLLVDMSIATNGSGIITGSIANTNWPAPAYLWASLPITSSGTTNYTFLLPAPTNTATNAALPPGDSYGLITEHNGNVTLSGGLADGTTFSQTVPLLESNDVPIYVSLYNKTGLLYGWLNLTNLGSTNAPDQLLWLKETAAKQNTLFPAGFTNELPAIGSIWTNPLSLTLPASNSLAIVSSNLDLNYTVVVTNKNKLINAGTTPTNILSGTINLKNGQVQFTFGTGDKKQTLRGFGAMLQNTNYAGGYFVTKTNAGSITLSVNGQSLAIPQYPEQLAPDETLSDYEDELIFRYPPPSVNR